MTVEPVTYVPLGLGDVRLLIPDGWSMVRMRGEALKLEGDDVPGLAAGIAEDAQGSFASNLMIYLGHDAIDVPASELGEGQILHDSAAEPGPVRRMVVLLRDELGTAITSVHLWAIVGGEALLVVATIAGDRLAGSWAAVRGVLEELVSPGDPALLEGWF
ncbi:MAG: hypothetical protein JWM47_1985 [Acidimicrobiales bacterium]|nr:hypothetical protein [Acidimicrobiales bacterium]